MTLEKDSSQNSEMERFEKETGKKAIYKGEVTKNYLDWKEGKKISPDPFKNEKLTIKFTEKGYKEKLQNFAEDQGISLTRFAKFSLDLVMVILTKLKLNLSDLDKDLDLILGLVNEALTIDNDVQSSLREVLLPLNGAVSLLDSSENSLQPDKMKEIIRLSEEKIKSILNVIESSKKGKTSSKVLLNKKKYNLLVLDDDLGSRQMVSQLFETLYKKTVKVFASTSEVLKDLEVEVPEVMLIDVRLDHDTPGDVFCSRLKEQYKIPIFLYTQNISFYDNIKDILQKSNADGVVAKPLEKPDYKTLLKYMSSAS